MMKGIKNKETRNVYEYLDGRIHKLEQNWIDLHNTVNCNSSDIGECEDDIMGKFNSLIRRILEIEVHVHELVIEEYKRKKREEKRG